eukprot:6190618-Pleurochrysis_carterae.AAC.2
MRRCQPGASSRPNACPAHRAASTAPNAQRRRRSLPQRCSGLAMVLMESRGPTSQEVWPSNAQAAKAQILQPATHHSPSHRALQETDHHHPVNAKAVS